MPNPRERLIQTIRESVVGDRAVLPGPFGPKPLVYADYTASGRALSFIEDYLREQVLPFYANTHSEASGSGRQTSSLREEARRIIHAALGGGPEDLVLFCGSGSTAAIDKLITVLGLRIPAELDVRHRLSAQIPLAERPVVFIGPHEHHSNELAWRESLATVVAIPEDQNGEVDLDALRSALLAYAARPLKIGSFSAASNVTGALTDTRKVTALLHRHGALSFWDYAAGGPYLPIEMNPEASDVAAELLQKDAVFLSPHKFVGGPGAAGVLVAKRHLFRNRVPSVPGGGTIAYVNARVHHYIPDVVMREEGGTPDILGSIRAGLAFQLKQAVGCQAIAEREESFVRRALGSFAANPKLLLLGDRAAPRLPVLSFLVRHEDRYLHHNFVVTLLSDLFGIQARGGCSCAGPYGHALLGVGLEASRAFEQQVLSGRLGIKPGWARINFSYFFSEPVFEYILRAVHFVAMHGHRFLSQYQFHAESGEWSHRAGVELPLARLSGIDYGNGQMQWAEGEATSQPESVLAGYLEQAQRLLECLAEARPHGGARPLPEDFERVRWFPLPGEVKSPPLRRELQQLRPRPINPRV